MQKVIVLDFGGQYNQLIVRRVREAGVYCEIFPCDTPMDDYADDSLCGLILTGGPQSVYADDSLQCDSRIFDLGVPILGICYGQQYLVHHFGGEVGPMDAREYGATDAYLNTDHPLFVGLQHETLVWMNHNDDVIKLPEGFVCIGHTDHCSCGAVANDAQKFYGIQFHPEVAHTQNGSLILQNFLNLCGCDRDWKAENVIDTMTADIKKTVGDGRVLCGLSGGVDSSVAATLVHKAVGKQLICVFVDHGLLRKDEGDQVMETFSQNLGLNVIRINAAERFIRKLKGVTDPEKKRKIIGNEFIEVFREEAERIGACDYLVQGTIYPDVIESGMGHAAVIKSHHNVGGLPEDIGFRGLIEPLRLLFKDEVRELGLALGVPYDIVWRQPFPGPGLAIRILGDITEDKLHIVRESDAILREEIKKAGLERAIWQYFTVYTPLKTVGVMGDMRTYANVLAVRAITSTDAMTVEAAEIPYLVLKRIMNRIIGEVEGVNRVVYDITSKPPGTVEWE